jgi:signal transduction histidine kinase
MRIKSILALTMCASLATILLLVAALSHTSTLIRKANADLALASDIRNLIADRIMLRDEYFIYREERPKTQWYSKTSRYSEQLLRAKADFRGAKDEEILAEMVEESRSIETLFSRLVANVSESGSEAFEHSLAEEYDKKLFSQLNIKSSVLRDDASRLVELRFGDLAALRRSSDWLFSACLAVVLALVLVNGSIIGRTLSRGILRLQLGVEAIGGGNLEYRIAADTDDEIGGLARGINGMAAALSANFTSIKDLDERIAQRTAQLGASNKELEAFAYSVAHDLRAPLRSIDGFSRILQEDSAARLDAEGLRLLGVIRSCAKEMDALISNLLEIARLGRTELSYSNIDMASMARSVFAALADPAVLSTFDFRVGDLPEAEADAVMIERVWSNLLANAIKYSMPSPLHRIEVSGGDDGGIKTYSVKDRGVGFDERFKDKLFRMFQRLHDKKDFEGTGVGLAIVERVISRHGGKVWAEGRPGEGATFHFSLPSRS